METQVARITKRLCSPRVQTDVNVGDVFLIEREDKDGGGLCVKRQSKDKKTHHISRSRFEWEKLGLSVLCKELEKEMARVKAQKEADALEKLGGMVNDVFEEADAGDDVVKRFVLLKMLVCEAVAAKMLDAFCDQCAVEKPSGLKKLCREARGLSARSLKEMRMMGERVYGPVSGAVKELEGMPLRSFQLWNLCNVAANNSVGNGSAEIRTKAIIAYFWASLSIEYGGIANEVAPTLEIRCDLCKKMRALALSAIGESVQLPDFSVMRGVYGNIFAGMFGGKG